MKRPPTSVTWCVLSLIACAPGVPASQDPRAAAEQIAIPVRQPSSAVLSADGRMLAFVLGDSLLVAATAGPGAPRVVATGVRAESDPNAFLAWSLDASRLVVRQGWQFGGAHPAAGMPVLVDVSTGASRPLIRDSLVRELETFRDWRAGGPRWSPDGRHIAFLAAPVAEPGSALHVYVADVTSGAVRRVSSRDAGNFSVAWSPDGRWLAYTTVAPHGDSSTLELLGAHALDGTNRVTTWRNETGPLRELIWSPRDNTVQLE